MTSSANMLHSQNYIVHRGEKIWEAITETICTCKDKDVLQDLILGGRQIQKEKYIEPPYTSTPNNK